MSATALLLSLLMIIAQAFFVAFEAAILVVRRDELSGLAEKGNRTARRVLSKMDQIDGYLATCQFGITITGLSLTAAFEPVVQDVLSPFLTNLMAPQLAASVSAGLAIAIATVFMVTFGELFPKAVAITVPTPYILATFRLMQSAYVLSTPFNATYNRMANSVVKLLTGKSVQQAHDTQSFEADALLGLAHEQGYINGEQRRLMNAALEFPTRTAREVMTPADQVVGFDIDEDEQAVYRRMREVRYARYPVFQDGELLGYVLMHDIFHQRLYRSLDLKAIIREVPGVPETVHLDRLRAEYREHPMMAVYDERNQFVGIITAEDLLEEIVGEVLDEDEEPDPPPVQRLASGNLLIDGTALVEEICSEVGLECDAPDGVDTFGGLLLSRLGREPKPGDLIRYQSWTFIVRECTGFSIRLVEGKGPRTQRANQQAS